MKQKTKNTIALLLALALAVELFIFYSDFNLVTDRTIELGILTLIISVGFIFFYFKNWKIQLLTGLPALLIGLVFLFYQFMGAYGGSEKISRSWKVDEYEISYATQEYFAGPGSKPYLLLRKKYLFGMLYKTHDVQQTEFSFTNLTLGRDHCILKFKKSKTEFDLCQKKQLK